jgi:hypothetical protein
VAKLFGIRCREGFLSDPRVLVLAKSGDRMTMLYALALATFVFASAASAQSTPDIDYFHNDSNVVMKLEGAVITITYLYPSSQMTSLGAEKGSPVFEGAISRKTDDISGNAYKYAGRCGRFPFLVSGRFADNAMSSLHLKGSAPIVDSHNCRVTRYAPVDLEFHVPE